MFSGNTGFRWIVGIAPEDPCRLCSVPESLPLRHYARVCERTDRPLRMARCTGGRLQGGPFVFPLRLSFSLASHSYDCWVQRLRSVTGQCLAMTLTSLFDVANH